MNLAPGVEQVVAKEGAIADPVQVAGFWAAGGPELSTKN